MPNYNPYGQNPYLYGNNYSNYGSQYQQQNYQPQYQQMLPTQMSGTYQQQVQQPQISITGRVVTKVDDIAVNEIPMDGNISYFPNQNGQEIYGKKWNADGTVSTILYKAELQQNDSENEKTTNPMDEYFKQIEGQFSELFDRVDELKQIVTPRQRKKEVSADD